MCPLAENGQTRLATTAIPSRVRSGIHRGIAKTPHGKEAALTLGSIPPRLTRPLYSFSEADYLAGAPRGTARRWLKGYSYVRAGERIERPAVTPKGGLPTAASFLDLLEVVVIGRFKALGLSLGAVRRIVTDCQELLGLPRPLVQLRFKTDGKDVFIERGDTLLGLGPRKRLIAWKEVLEPFLEQLDYSDVWAERWWPLGHDAAIMIDPEYGFGRPVIAGSGVRTEIVLERFRAGDLPEEIAEDFNLDKLKVIRAIQYETTRAAA